MYAWGAVVLLTVISAVLHFWRLGQPGELVFDEVYYPKWGEDYLQGQSFFDVHPPLGKLLIAVGVWLFHASPEAGTGAFGWRFMAALFGTLITPLTYLVAIKIFGEQKTVNSEQGTTHNDNSSASASLGRDGQFTVHSSRSATAVALLSALFVTIDGLLLVQGRIALLDSFLVAFVLAAYASFLWFRDAQTLKSASWYLVLTGIFFGLAIATKWTGAAPIGVLLIWFMAFRRKLPAVKPLVAVASFIIIPAAIYIVSFIFNERSKDFWPYLLEWHIQTWNFHAGLHSTHPYESRWWSWLYLARPVWYYYKDSGDGLIRGIIALGNPILWWGGIIALMASLIGLVRRNLALILPTLAFLAAYAPWWFIGRTQFQYYIVGGVPFLFMLLAWWLVRCYQLPGLRPLVISYVTLSLLSFIFFFPLLTAYPITNEYYKLHIWFKRWI